jgi:ATP synthase protein I
MKIIKSKNQKSHREFHHQVKIKSQRKLKARQEGDKSIWYNLGLIGFVGWSITLPTLIGIAVGIWIDQKFPSPYSWTLMMLFIGVILGCINAWYWVQQESNDE